MVLASNEWLNFCEDEQKSANATTTAATTTTTTANTTSATSTATATETTSNTTTAAIATDITTTTATINAVDISNDTNNVISVSLPRTVLSTTATTAENNSIASTTVTTNSFSTAINAQATTIDNANSNEQQILDLLRQQQQQQPKPPPPTYEEVLLFNSNNLKIMSDNNTNNTLPTTTNTTNALKRELMDTANADATDALELDNNNLSLLLQSNFLNEALNENISSIPTSCTLSINSNTNTLQSPLNVLRTTGSKNGATTATAAAPPPLQAPITPQALSSALQSVMNAAATANNANNPGANLQTNFLSSLGIGVANSVALQQSAKQFSSNFCVPSNLETNAQLNLSATNSTGSVEQHTGDAETLSNGQAKIVLLCEANSHPFQTRTILLTPNIECKVGRLIAKSKAAESNAIFDCKVLSRNHAVLWYSDDGKFWVKDTKSSNGTFINENKLGNEAAELHFGDIVKFGVDVLENSRKEVHGCIIAFVKLYLPDGREAISIDSSTARSQYSGDGRISYEELYRLNLYMQEASQREKVLKSKLFNLQNLLDATRKNSALCWQSMIAEDQLLHRIHSLEKKLQIMEKNVPESVLRNEVLKLLEDKNSYQHTAKEALRKVYQERCDTLQKLSKMESAYAASDNECKLLRDQIMNTKQSLQDVNSRLLGLESEYNEYKEANERQQQEAKDQEEQRIAELSEKLRRYELDCEELRRKISELMLKRGEQLNEDEKQAIDKLDAAIADMDLDDDDVDVEDKDEDGDADADANANANDAVEKEVRNVNHINGASPESKGVADNYGARTTATPTKGRNKNKKSNTAIDANLMDTSSSSGSSEKGKMGPALAKTKSKSKRETTKARGIKHKVVKESTIMKWLQNSDLNKTEGSLDIFKAICNESDSSDEHSPNKRGASTDTSAGTATTKKKRSSRSKKAVGNEDEFEQKCMKFTSKLQSVQRNLKTLEAEIANETNKAENTIAALDDGSTLLGSSNESDEDEAVEDEELDVEVEEVDEEEEDEFVVKRCTVLPKDNKSYMLLKRSVSMLREAYNEICDSVKQQQEKEKGQCIELKTDAPIKIKKAKSTTPPPAISLQTQFQNYAPGAASNSALKKCNSSQEEIKAEHKYIDEDENDIEEECEEEESSATLTITHLSTEDKHQHPSSTKVTAQLKEMAQEISSYQNQIAELRDKMEQNENDAQNTLEIMQIECDTFKEKIGGLNSLIETLREEKKTLEEVLKGHQNVEATKPQVDDEVDKVDRTDAAVIEEVKIALVTKPSETKESTTVLCTSIGDEVKVEKAPLSARESMHNFEQEIQEELQVINSAPMQREEELIMYKEYLEQQQQDNLILRKEIADLKLRGDNQSLQLMRRCLPYCAAAVAVVVYFLTTYH